MKFELEPYHRDVPLESIVDDLQRVAAARNRPTLTQREYQEFGLYSPSMVGRRFGSWKSALSAAGLNAARRNDAVSASDCLEDLTRVAKSLGTATVTADAYVEHGKYSVGPFVRHFGSWFGALDEAGLERSRTLHVRDEDYFENLEEMWVALGRQPRYQELQKPFSRYSAGAYENRFGSWRRALEAFVTSANSEDSESEAPSIGAPDRHVPPASCAPAEPRTISWRLRFLVMRRDSFKCCACGRSPATDPGVVLHIDHVVPWSKDGPTQMENLQTLCMECNVGKSDLPWAPPHG